MTPAEQLEELLYRIEKGTMSRQQGLDHLALMRRDLAVWKEQIEALVPPQDDAAAMQGDAAAGLQRYDEALNVMHRVLEGDGSAAAARALELAKEGDDIIRSVHRQTDIAIDEALEE